MIPAIIGAGASLLGGLFGMSQADKQAQMQKEFAQNGVQWKVADAKKAGIHPLAALGAQTISYSPMSVGMDMGTGIANAGQDIAQGIHRTRTQSQKADAYTKTAQDLSLQRMGLENQLLASQIAKVNQVGSAPPMAAATDPYLIGGQTQSGLVQDQSLQRVNAAPTAPNQEPGAVTDVGYTRTHTGLAPVYSNDAKERLEEDMIGGLMWNVRNRLMPTLGIYNNLPAEPLKKDHEWVYDSINQTYVQVPKKLGKGPLDTKFYR